jgi:GntR family uxuAB operon transcriptional repressor
LQELVAQVPAPLVAEHDHIVEAIADRDPDSAREAMRVHLRHVRRTLFGDND